MHTALHRRLAVGALLLAAMGVLAGVCARAGLAWVDRPFPGFFTLPNGAIASTRPAGSVATDLTDLPADAALRAVDGVPLLRPEAVYALAAAVPVGTALRYQLRGDAQEALLVPTRRFTEPYAILTFVVYFWNGLVFAGIGIGAWALGTAGATRWALLSLGLSVGTWAFTAIERFAPGECFRLHVLAESMIPGALLHLALVFPEQRAGTRRALAIAYGPALALATVQQITLASPTAYAATHALAVACTVFAALDVAAAVLVGYLRSGAPLVRHRTHIALLGLFAGFVNPLLLLLAALLDRNPTPLNLAGLTAGIFPLAVAYAAHKRDLFEIDAFRRRGLGSVVVSGFVTALSLVLGAVATHLHVAWHGESTLSSMALALGAPFTFPELRARGQQVIERWWVG